VSRRKWRVNEPSGVWPRRSPFYQGSSRAERRTPASFDARRGPAAHKTYNNRIAIVAIRQRDAAFALHGDNKSAPNRLLARWDELRRREVSAVNQRRDHRGWLGNVSGSTWLVSRRFSQCVRRALPAALECRGPRDLAGQPGDSPDRVRQYAGCNDRLPALVRQSGDSSKYPLRAILEISQARGKFKTLFVLKLPLSILPTRTARTRAH